MDKEIDELPVHLLEVLVAGLQVADKDVFVVLLSEYLRRKGLLNQIEVLLPQFLVGDENGDIPVDNQPEEDGEKLLVGVVEFLNAVVDFHQQGAMDFLHFQQRVDGLR